QVMREVRRNEFALEEQLSEAETKGDEATRNRLLSVIYPESFLKKQKILGAFIRKYPHSPVSIFVLEEFAGDAYIDISTVEPILEILRAANQDGSIVQKVAG